jgi:hypothetical protein
MTNLETLKNLLQSHGWTYLGSGEESGYPDEDLESYRGWEIFLYIPNGGILSVDVIHAQTGGWWGIPTYEQFGYYDSDGITAFAKGVIDEVERCLAEVPGQLSLFEVEL